VYLAGEALTETDERGRPLRDRNFLLLFNAHHEPVPFKLPDYAGTRWRVLLDTGVGDGLAMHDTFDAGVEYKLQGRCLVLLRQAST
jgi:glycogen operon protein